MKMKKMVSAIAALAMSVSAFAGLATVAHAETTTFTPAMTYVDYNQADVAMGDTTPARTGYHKNSGLGFGNTGWGCNWTTYLKLDVTSITDTITSAILTLESSGSTDSKRTAGVGLAEVAYNGWDNTLTYNTAVANGMNAGTGVTVGQQWTSSKSATTFNTLTYDVTDLINNDADGIITVALYETNAGGCYIQNPVLTVESTTAAIVDYTINYNFGDTTVKTVTDSAAAGVTVNAELPFEDNNVKYSAAEGATTSMVLSAEGANVLNVDLKAAYPVTTATVNYNLDGVAILSETKAVTGYEGDTATVGFKKYILVDGTVYESAQGNAGFYISNVTLADGVALDVNVTAKAIEGTPVAVVEASGSTGDYANIRSSEGEATRGAVSLGTVEPGVYSIEAITYQRGGDTHVYLNGEVLCAFALNSGSWGVATTTDIVVPEAGELTVGPGTSSSDYIDCLVLVKTGEYVAPVDPVVYTGTIEVFGTYSGDGYEGEATALTATFEVAEDESFNTVTVAAADNAENAVTKTVTTVTGGSAVYGIVVTSICDETAVVATATLAE